jgi:hypothetical protein
MAPVKNKKSSLLVLAPLPRIGTRTSNADKRPGAIAAPKPRRTSAQVKVDNAQKLEAKQAKERAVKTAIYRSADIEDEQRKEDLERNRHGNERAKAFSSANPVPTQVQLAKAKAVAGVALENEMDVMSEGYPGELFLQIPSEADDHKDQGDAAGIEDAAEEAVEEDLSNNEDVDRPGESCTRLIPALIIAADMESSEEDAMSFEDSQGSGEESSDQVDEEISEESDPPKKTKKNQSKTKQNTAAPRTNETPNDKSTTKKGKSQKHRRIEILQSRLTSTASATPETITKRKSGDDSLRYALIHCLTNF